MPKKKCKTWDEIFVHHKQHPIKIKLIYELGANTEIHLSYSKTSMLWRFEFVGTQLHYKSKNIPLNFQIHTLLKRKSENVTLKKIKKYYF